VSALDHAAARPVNRHAEDPPRRAQQRFDALIRIAEASLSGGGAVGTPTTRPRARIFATVDLSAADGARLLWGLPGRPPRLSRLATEVLSCDADLVPVSTAIDSSQSVGRRTRSQPPRDAPSSRATAAAVSPAATRRSAGATFTM